MITVFVLVEIFQLFRFEWCRPENVPIRIFTLTETGPSQSIHGTVICVNVVRNFELQPEKIFIKLRD